MKNDRNPITSDIVDKLNGKPEDDTNIYYEKINDFKTMVKDKKAIEKIKSSNKLKNMVLDVYNIIIDNYINDL